MDTTETHKPDTAGMQLWLINAHGGEAWHLTDLAHGPKQAEWLDKDTIVFSAPEDPTLYETEMKRKKDDSDVIDDADHEPPVRLYKINVKDGKITRLTTNTDWIETFQISHDGKYVVASHAKSLHYSFDQKVHPIVILHSLTGGDDKQLFTDLRIRPEGFEWSLDNSGFYMATPFSTDARFMTAGITIVYFYDLASGKATQVNLDWQSGLGYDLQAVYEGVNNWNASIVFPKTDLPNPTFYTSPPFVPVTAPDPFPEGFQQRSLHMYSTLNSGELNFLRG